MSILIQGPWDNTSPRPSSTYVRTCVLRMAVVLPLRTGKYYVPDNPHTLSSDCCKVSSRPLLSGFEAMVYTPSMVLGGETPSEALQEPAEAFQQPDIADRSS